MRRLCGCRAERPAPIPLRAEDRAQLRERPLLRLCDGLLAHLQQARRLRLRTLLPEDQPQNAPLAIRQSAHRRDERRLLLEPRECLFRRRVAHALPERRLARLRGQRLPLP